MRNTVTSGSMVIRDTATVREVSSGGVLIADTVRGLRKVHSGGAVISDDVRSTDVTLTSGGGIYSSINEYIAELEQQRRRERRLDVEFMRRSTTEKIDKLKKIRDERK